MEQLQFRHEIDQIAKNLIFLTFQIKCGALEIVKSAYLAHIEKMKDLVCVSIPKI